MRWSHGRRECLTLASDLSTIERLCRLRSTVSSLVTALEDAEQELGVITLTKGISDGMMARMGEAWVETGQGARRARGLVREIEREIRMKEETMKMRETIRGRLR